MRLGALFSGGKDSTFAIYLSQKQGHTIDCLITIHPSSDESLLFHYPNSHLVKYLAKSMNKGNAEGSGIPLLEVELSNASGNGKLTKAEEADALETAIKRAISTYNIQGIVSGGIASVFQKQAFEEVCKKYGLVPFSPLWGVNVSNYMKDLLANHFSVMIVGVSAMGLDKDWLGKVIESESLEKLERLSRKYGFNLAFEGGEAETLVIDCPLYSKKLEVKNAKAHWDGQRGIFEILEADLV